MITHKGYRGCQLVVIYCARLQLLFFFFILQLSLIMFSPFSRLNPRLNPQNMQTRNRRVVDQTPSDAQTLSKQLMRPQTTSVSPQAVPLLTMLVKWKCCVMYW